MLYSMPRAYVLRGTNNGSVKKKNHPKSHPGNAQKQLENKPFRATAPMSKKTTPPNLTIIDKYAKTLRKINVFEGVAGDDPGTSKTNLGP